ncbi:hypothetical protein H0H93_002417, partial [Arthromyces matolae]
LAQIHSTRYLNQREVIKKSPALLRLLLHDWKLNRPDIFRSYVRIDPDCFDSLVDVIKDDPIFHNQSNNPQMPVEEQTAIALYRFGHHGSAASTMKLRELPAICSSVAQCGQEGASQRMDRREFMPSMAEWVAYGRRNTDSSVSAARILW